MFALAANNKNGRRLTTADKKHAILLALQTWPEKSMHMLAEQIGCSYQFVQQEKPKVASTCHLPSRVTGKDGKSCPASSRACADQRTRRFSAAEMVPPIALAFWRPVVSCKCAYRFVVCACEWPSCSPICARLMPWSLMATLA